MQPGDRVDKYVLEEKLGEGGMAEVWRARHPDLEKVVAIKCLASRLTSNPEFEQRFLNEGRRQASLRHPNIIPVLDFIAEGENRYLVMEYVEGESLETVLRRAGGPLPAGHAGSIARQVVAALDYAHQRSLIHRDVKPSNILLDREGRVYLTDFGIALMLGEQRLTRHGVAVGTAHYMSPEQINRPREVDPRSDIYSFGCVLYEMLSGRPPFAEGEPSTDFSVMAGHLQRTPAPLRQSNPAVPAPVEAVVMRCLAKQPRQRFGSAAELQEALSAAFAAQPAVKRRMSPAWVYVAVALAALGAAAAGAYFLTGGQPAAKIPDTPRAIVVKPPEAQRPPEPPAKAPEVQRVKSAAAVKTGRDRPAPQDARLKACRALGLSETECAQRAAEDEKRKQTCRAMGLSEEECAQLGK